MKKVFVLVSVALLFILAGCIRLNPSIKVSLESANGEIPYFSICKYEISFLTKGISSLSFESDGELSTYSHVLGDKDFSLSIYADSEAKKLVVIGRDSKGRELARKQLELTGGGRDIEESAVETDGIYTSEIPLGFYSLPFIRGKSFQQRLLILLELEGKGGYLILAGYGWRWLEYLQWLTSGVPGPVKAEELDLPTTIAENRETGELFDVITGELVGENEPPVAEKVSGPEGEINQGSSTFTWTGDDPDGEIEKYEYRKDGGAWTSNGLNTNYTWNDYTEGAHTFEVRAQDNEGDYSNTIIWEFNYDKPNEPPVADKVSGPEGEINQSSSTFTWTGDDPDGEIEKYEYRKDGGAWTNNGLNTNYTWNDYTEGAHTFEVRAQDNEGAYSNTIIWEFNYDKPNEPPVVDKVSGPEGEINQGSSTFTWTGDDPDGEIEKYEYRKDGGAWTNNGLNTNYTWNDYTEGAHTFEVRAQDNEGAYSNTIIWEFNYDKPNEPPVVDKVSGPEGEINQSSSTFTWTGDDPDGEIEKYEYRKDGGAWTSNGLNTNYTWNDYTEGAHTFEVRAQDNEGAYSNIIIWNFYYLVFIGETVKVEGGTFIMGSDAEEGLYEWCKPVHQVTITYTFEIGLYEVSFDEYDAFCEATGRGKPSDQGWGRGQRPVINVSWWDAIAYCNWVSEREGLPVAYRLLGETDEGQMLDANGNVTTDITQVVGCRLPTEAEWEYAARGGKHHSPYKYSGSDNVDEVAWYSGNSGNKTHEVGLKLPNALGIYDMSGNVEEWCSDSYYEYTDSPKTNPYTPYDSSSTYHLEICRGGCYEANAESQFIWGRGWHVDYREERFLGFRVCRKLP